MPLDRLRSRPLQFLDQIRARDVGELHRSESVLATAREILAVSSLVAIYVDPTEPTRYAQLAYTVLLIYVTYSAVILAVLRIRKNFTPRFSLVLHGVDLVWPAFISLFTEGPNSPFFPFFLFVLLAAAYRWGLQETMATAAGAVILLYLEAGVLLLGPRYFGPLVEGYFEWNRLIIRAAYLLILGFLIGYLAREEKELRAEAAVVARVMGKAQVELGLRGTLQGVLSDFLALFDASHALLAIQEVDTGKSFLWELARPTADSRGALRLTEIETARQGTYFGETPAEAWHVVWERRKPRENNFDLLALDSEGNPLRDLAWEPPGSFPAAHPFSSALLGISFRFRNEWWGRLFLLDPQCSLSRDKDLRFAQNLLRRVLPSVYNVYILRRLRSQAGALERARVARELHDGVLQSVSAAVMRVDLLRRQVGGQSAAAEELTRIQQILRQEVVNLRELMEQMKPVDIDPRHLLEFLADLVEKFHRETGINARFISDLDRVAWRPRVCREVARIVQEGLVNVRRHSGARNVIVQLGAQDGNWQLVIDDDGNGFPFSGRLSQRELDAARRGPVVIKERVRAVGGELTVVSEPGRGSRLEIVIPEK